VVGCLLGVGGGESGGVGGGGGGGGGPAIRTGFLQSVQ